MKKNALIFGIVISLIGLIALSAIYSNNDKTNGVAVSSIENNADIEIFKPIVKDENRSRLFLSIGTPYTTIKKQDLDTLTDFADIIGEKHANTIVSYKSVSVIVLDDDKQTDTKETSTSGTFTPQQLALLQSADYASNFVIWADYLQKNEETGEVEDGQWTPYLSVVPEIQAVHIMGNKALLDYINDSTQSLTKDLADDRLQQARFYFKVTKEGDVTDINVIRDSGYAPLDDKIIELVKNTSYGWLPAENATGEKVDQVLLFSYGRSGC
jgi:hypothetical protein